MILSDAGHCIIRKCAEGSGNQSLGPVWSRSHQSRAMSTVVSYFITSCDARVVWVQGEGNVCRAYHCVCEDATAICVNSEVKGEH
jgi:hypothetical protein